VNQAYDEHLPQTGMKLKRLTRRQKYYIGLFIGVSILLLLALALILALVVFKPTDSDANSSTTSQSNYTNSTPSTSFV